MRRTPSAAEWASHVSPRISLRWRLTRTTYSSSSTRLTHFHRLHTKATAARQMTGPQIGSRSSGGSAFWRDWRAQRTVRTLKAVMVSRAITTPIVPGVRPMPVPTLSASLFASVCCQSSNPITHTPAKSLPGTPSAVHSSDCGPVVPSKAALPSAGLTVVTPSIVHRLPTGSHTWQRSTPEQSGPQKPGSHLHSPPSHVPRPMLAPQKPFSEQSPLPNFG